MSAEGSRGLRRDAAENLGRILEVAPVVFAEQGWGASMDEVARRAGVGVGTIYRRFPTKEALVDAVLAERARLMTEWASEAVVEADAWDGLVAFIERVMEAPGGVLAFRSMVQLRWSAEQVARFFAGFAPRMLELIERGQAAGRFRADLVLSDLPMLIVALDTVRVTSEEVAPELWRRTLGIYLDGLRPEAASELAVPGLAPERIIALMSGVPSEGGGD